MQGNSVGYYCFSWFSHKEKPLQITRHATWDLANSARTRFYEQGADSVHLRLASTQESLLIGGALEVLALKQQEAKVPRSETKDS